MIGAKVMLPDLMPHNLLGYFFHRLIVRCGSLSNWLLEENYLILVV